MSELRQERLNELEDSGLTTAAETVGAHAAGQSLEIISSDETSESEDVTFLKRRLDFASSAYRISEDETWPELLDQLANVLPGVIMENKKAFPPGSKKSLERNTQRLRRWLEGADAAEVIAEKPLTEEQVRNEMKIFSRRIGHAVSWSQVIERMDLGPEELERARWLGKINYNEYGIPMPGGVTRIFDNEEELKKFIAQGGMPILVSRKRRHPQPDAA